MNKYLNSKLLLLITFILVSGIYTMQPDKDIMMQQIRRGDIEKVKETFKKYPTLWNSPLYQEAVSEALNTYQEDLVDYLLTEKDKALKAPSVVPSTPAPKQITIPAIPTTTTSSVKLTTPTYTAKTTLAKPTSWNLIDLPNKYIRPDSNTLTINNKAYRLDFPATPLQWFEDEKECAKEQGSVGQYNKTNQTRLRSNYISSLSGFSFKGRVNRNPAGGSRKNEFAIFFHQNKCYNGGPEYGFVFFEDMQSGLFYVCGDCNTSKQQWWDWPGTNKGNVNVTGEHAYVANALENPSQYRYWNIKILENGDFLIEVVDPSSYETHTATIKKPDWLPNLYQVGGYITLNAKKEADSKATPGYIQADEIKVWQ